MRVCVAKKVTHNHKKVGIGRDKDHRKLGCYQIRDYVLSGIKHIIARKYVGQRQESFRTMMM